jgi:hypothetical protein
MKIYRITIVDLSDNGKVLYTSDYHTTEHGPYRQAIHDNMIVQGQPIDKDWQIIFDTKQLITD